MEPDRIVRRGVFQVMEGRRVIADMTPNENLKLGAFTRITQRAAVLLRRSGDRSSRAVRAYAR
jgi:branched-chain amino acid transport system ATP-binding protein